MKVHHFNSILECILWQEEKNRKKLKMSEEQYSRKCFVSDCRNEAEVVIKTSIWKKIRRFFRFEFNYDGARYCKKHVKEMCKVLHLNKENFKENSLRGSEDKHDI